MVKFLAMQIRLHKIALDDVPDKYRDAVEAELESKGVENDG